MTDWSRAEMLAFEQGLFKLQVASERGILPGPYEEGAAINHYFHLWHQSMLTTQEKILNMVDEVTMEGDTMAMQIFLLRNKIKGLYA